MKKNLTQKKINRFFSPESTLSAPSPTTTHPKPGTLASPSLVSRSPSAAQSNKLLTPVSPLSSAVRSYSTPPAAKPAFNAVAVAPPPRQTGKIIRLPVVMEKRPAPVDFDLDLLDSVIAKMPKYKSIRDSPDVIMEGDTTLTDLPDDVLVLMFIENLEVKVFQLLSLMGVCRRLRTVIAQNVRRFNVNSMVEFQTSNAQRRLLSNFVNLESLVLQDCRGRDFTLSDDDLVLIYNRCKRLRRLVIDSSCTLTEKSFRIFGSRITLREFSARRCLLMNDTALSALLSNGLLDLRSVDLTMTFVTENGLMELVKYRGRYLETLIFAHNPIPWTQVAALMSQTNFDSLRNLSLGHTLITDTLLAKLLAPMKYLLALCIAHCAELSVNVIRIVGDACPELCHLDARGLPKCRPGEVADWEGYALSFPNLMRIRLSDSKALTLEQAIVFASGCKSLKDIELTVDFPTLEDRTNAVRRLHPCQLIMYTQKGKISDGEWPTPHWSDTEYRGLSSLYNEDERYTSNHLCAYGPTVEQIRAANLAKQFLVAPSAYNYYADVPNATIEEGVWVARGEIDAFSHSTIL